MVAKPKEDPAPPEPEAPPGPVIEGPHTSAAASGDPAVHQLLAERQTAVSNGDDEKAAEIDKALADLGYS